MTSYNETVLRFRIVRHDELPEGHKVALRAHGIDPDTRWSLIYSFDTFAAADAELARQIKDAAEWESYRLVDGEAATEISRPVW